MRNLIDSLNWRYATKKFDPSKFIPDDQLERILEAVRLAPTSAGLQPFELLVISNPEIKSRIRTVGWDQAQISDCSHLLVFAAWDDITPDRINMMFDLTNQVRGFTNEVGENFRAKLLDMFAANSPETNFQTAARQTFIGLGAALVAAAVEEIDATPMEGFDPAAVDDILGLKEKNLRSVVIVPMGYRDIDGDWLVNLKKVRRSRDHFVTELR